MRALQELTAENVGLYIEQLLAIERTSFSAPWTLDDYLTEVARPIAHIVVVTDGDTLLGYAGFWQVMEVAEVNNVAVAEEFRGQGIGKMLMAGLLDLAALLGCEQVHLEVRAGNAGAIALYDGLGFSRVGLRPDYYDNPREDAVLMTCEVGGRLEAVCN